MRIRTEIEPRWEYDCGHCKFSWQCGPVCACMPRVNPNSKKQHWFLVVVPGKHWESEWRKGVGIAEVRHTRLIKGARVVYRLGKRPKEGGVIGVAGKWTEGILKRVSSRWNGEDSWGFKILTIEPV